MDVINKVHLGGFDMARLKNVIVGILAAVVLLPFTAGAEGECPNEMVFVDRSFCIDIYEYPNQEGAMPETGVTWEEASRMCAGRGKRLCTYNEWRRTCSGSQGYKYPYGNNFRPGACNDSHVPGEKGVRPAGSMSECVSEDGVYAAARPLPWTPSIFPAT